MSLYPPIRTDPRTQARRILLIVALAFVAGACQSAECADGLNLQDGRCADPDGTCGTCGTHEFCDTSVFPNACRCAPGYEGDPCTFTGLIVDPGFGGLEDPNTGDPYWRDEGDKGATVLPFAQGDRDLGEGALDNSVINSVICNAGSLKQAVEMPGYDIAEPFVVEVNYTAEGVHGLAVGFNRSWKRLAATDSSWRNETFCLGEGGYGEAPTSQVDVRLSASERLADCLVGLGGAGRIRVDTFEIRPAGATECPEPGMVVNGTAELGGKEWLFLTDGDVEALEAGLDADAGSLGTGGARLFRDAGVVGSATMSTRLSVPLAGSTSFPALVFWWRGTTRQLFEVELGTLINLDDRGRQVDTLVGTIDTQVDDNAGVNHIYCLPPWTHGSVLDLSFSLPEGVSAEPVELVVDDVAITSDNACGNDEDLLDPGFESAPNRWPGASLGSADEALFMQRDSALARGGNGLLELTYWTSNAESDMETYVLIPQSDGDRGPAVTFHSRSSTPPSTDVQWVLGRSEVTLGDVQTEENWHANEACLPPQWAGRWFRFQVRVGPPPVSGGPIEQERIYLDDFSLGTSADCPAQ